MPLSFPESPAADSCASPTAAARQRDPSPAALKAAMPEPALRNNLLCEVMGIYPLTLLTLAYTGDGTHEADQLLTQVRQELRAISKKHDAP
jgi:hypothetical protein